MKTLVLAGLRGLGGRRPAAAVRTAGALARATRPLDFGIDEERLAALFPDLDAEALTAARHATWSNHLRRVALSGAHAPGRPRPWQPPLVAAPSPEGLAGPVVLTSFHLGPHWALGVLLERIEGEVIGLSRGDRTNLEGLTILRAGEDAVSRSAAFLRIVRQVRRGAAAFALADAGEAAGPYALASLDAPLLGHRLTLARGPFALARLARAPIVPIVARWQGDRAAIVKGDPILVSDEGEAAVELTRWLEGYLRRSPGEITPFLLARVAPAGREAGGP